MLSDACIREHIARNELLLDVDASSATQAAFHFTGAKIYTGGKESTLVDWEKQPLDPNFHLQPGAMIWVRMKGRVKLPINVCAMWWQTHTLSEQGVMLVNMSVVDPGYEGYLACLFTNFGTKKVVITPKTPMAKMVFYYTDRDVATPYTKSTSLPDYDNNLESIAANGPDTFLRISELVPALNVRKEEILREIASDAPKRVFAAYGIAAVGFALLVGATTFVPWLQSTFQPNLKSAVQKAVDERISEHLSLSPTPDQLRTQERITSLEAQISDLKMAGQRKPKPASKRKRR